MSSVFRRIRTLGPATFCVVVIALLLTSHRQARAVLIRTFARHALVLASGDRGVTLLECRADFDGVVTPAGELESFAVLSVTLSDFHAFVDALLEGSSSKVGRTGIFAAADPKVAGSFPGLDSFVMVTLPYWLLLLLAAPRVALPIRRWFIRRRRKRKGLCQTCGYDLRMSTGRCPECGTNDDAADVAEMQAAS
jgi:hypothetical protein